MTGSTVADEPIEPAGGASGLVGRARELEVIDGMLARLDQGGGSLLLRGEAGVGKSALLRRAAELARRRGHLVLTAGGTDGDVMPYASLRRLLPPWMIESVELPPGQRAALFAATRPDDPAVVPAPYLVGMAALTAVTEAAESRPITLAIDDAHWLDAESRSVIAFLGRRLAADPVLLIVATRPVDDPDDAVEATTTITVPALHDGAANALLDAVAPDLDPFIRGQILHAARGNPLALTELPRTWAHTAPAHRAATANVPVGDHIRSSFAGSYRGLPALSRDVLLVAALDEHAPVAEILEAAEVFHGGHVPAEALGPCAAAGLITVTPAEVLFRHPLVRAAVVGSDDAERVRAAHRALAVVLARSDRRGALAHRAQAAHGTDDGLADDLAEAARAAHQRAETTPAIWLMERAARVTGQPGVRGHRLLMAATWAYELGDRRTVNRLRAAACADPLDTLDQIRAAWLAELFTGHGSDDVGRILDLHDDVRVAWRAGDLELAWNVLMSIASRCYWTRPDAPTRQLLATTALALPVAGSEHRLVFALSGIDQVGHTPRILAECRRALTRDISDANALRMYAMGAVVVGDALLARAFADEAERLLRAQGRLGLLPHVLLTRIQADWFIGHWDRARTALDEGRRLADETGQPTWRNSARLNEARLAALTGESRQLERTLAEINAEAVRQGTTSFLPRVQVVLGTALVARGAYQEGFDALRPVFDPQDPLYDPRSTFPAVMFLADAAVHTDRRALARQLIGGVREVLGPVAPVDFSVVDGYADAVLADDDRAEERYVRALDGDATQWPWVRARLGLAYGGWLRRQRRDLDAVPQLQLALAGLSRLGAMPWVEQARHQLRAAGEHTALPRVVAREVLTGEQLQIASLAAAGLSNREIGEQLFMSPRTVSSHLYRIFPKLGITSRGQLAAVLDD
ncbi:regulatory LuxR family protein [Asanoa ferruginea]|uniref:Regulatory LuxR family protein n=1 Tax=Asanoa ferruginea TaxID=53367 RepID=A0A3D9ZY80_9ACTN|nr:LuxR family transcriptional regulator [Asanoa ferruginea]REG01094.1 regulatory LuxR family protein [Asanoa ferruginea]GIF47207.1 LuxR family transcriptional regulator [Asanoa ferruginea]